MRKILNIKALSIVLSAVLLLSICNGVVDVMGRYAYSQDVGKFVLTIKPQSAPPEEPPKLNIYDENGEQIFGSYDIKPGITTWEQWVTEDGKETGFCLGEDKWPGQWDGLILSVPGGSLEDSRVLARVIDRPPYNYELVKADEKIDLNEKYILLPYWSQ